jgi:hypothetical protein
VQEQCTGKQLKMINDFMTFINAYLQMLAIFCKMIGQLFSLIEGEVL